MGGMVELALVVWVQESWGMINLATTQAQFYSFELAHPNIYHIYDLLEYMKGPVLHTQSCRTSMTQDVQQQDIQEETH